MTPNLILLEVLGPFVIITFRCWWLSPGWIKCKRTEPHTLRLRGIGHSKKLLNSQSPCMIFQRWYRHQGSKYIYFTRYIRGWEWIETLAILKQKDKTGALGYSEFRGLWTILGMWKVRCLKELFRLVWNIREKSHLKGKTWATERNCLHETLKSLEIWDEPISVILRFLDAHKLSRTWSASAQKLYSGACLVDQIWFFDWIKQTGLNRIFEKRQSCLSSGGHVVSCKFFDLKKNTLY